LIEQKGRIAAAAGIAYRLGFAGFEEDLLTATDTNTKTMVIGTAGRIADRFNPITGGPAEPLKLESQIGRASCRKRV
jgi:uncharacterized membrane protein YhfC